jgi:hypothetical protein
LQDAYSYGWNTIHSCSEYAYGSAHYVKNEYDTEHVLEWSVITGFFNQLSSQYGGKDGTDFVHPDPQENGKKISFCKYWKATWDLPRSQTMPNPAPQNGLKSPVLERKPAEWIAANYPYKFGTTPSGAQEFVDEFTLLQKKINSPAKNAVSAVLSSRYLHAYANQCVIDVFP